MPLVLQLMVKIELCYPIRHGLEPNAQSTILLQYRKMLHKPCRSGFHNLVLDPTNYTAQEH